MGTGLGTQVNRGLPLVVGSHRKWSGPNYQTLPEDVFVDGELDCDASREIVLHQRVWQFSGLISMPVQAGGGPFASNRVP